MTGIKKVLLNSTYLISFRMLSRLLSTVFMLYAARKLSPDIFGVLSLTLVTVELLSALGDLGITKYGARELVRFWGERPSLTGQILSLQVITQAILTTAGFVTVIAFIPSSLKLQLLLLALACFFFYSLINTSESVFIASQKFFFSALLSFIGRLIYLVIGFAVLADRGSVVLVMWGFLASVIVETALRMAIAIRITGISFRFSLKRLMVMMRVCIPFAVAGIASIISIRSCVFILEFLKGDASVGVFNAAYTLFTPFVWVPLILTSVTFPGLTATYNNDPDAARRSGWQWYRLMAIVGIPAAVAVSLLAGAVTNFFPSKYEEIKPIIIILMWSMPPALITAIDINILQVIDRQAAAARGLVLSAVGSILFSLALIPFLGGAGAAVAYLFMTVMRTAYIHYQVRLNFFDKTALILFARPLIAGAAMAVPGLILLIINSWLAMGLSLIVYTLFMIAMGVLKPDERSRLAHEAHS